MYGGDARNKTCYCQRRLKRCKEDQCRGECSHRMMISQSVKFSFVSRKQLGSSRDSCEPKLLRQSDARFIEFGAITEHAQESFRRFRKLASASLSLRSSRTDLSWSSEVFLSCPAPTVQVLTISLTSFNAFSLPLASPNRRM